jgi:hypothetical protein
LEQFGRYFSWIDLKAGKHCYNTTSNINELSEKRDDFWWILKKTAEAHVCVAKSSTLLNSGDWCKHCKDD